IHTLRAVGYTSTLIGMQHLAKDPQRIGYDHIVAVADAQTENVAPAAAGFLSRAPQHPFFLDVGFFETHRPFPSPGPDEDPRYCLPPPALPDTPDTRQDMAAYKASARILDWGIGVVLDALEANGLVENTLIICTTD